jgi:hypothetical protein
MRFRMGKEIARKLAIKADVDTAIVRHLLRHKRRRIAGESSEDICLVS